MFAKRNKWFNSYHFLYNFSFLLFALRLDGFLRYPISFLFTTRGPQWFEPDRGSTSVNELSYAVLREGNSTENKCLFRCQ